MKTKKDERKMRQKPKAKAEEENEDPNEGKRRTYKRFTGAIVWGPRKYERVVR